MIQSSGKLPWRRAALVSLPVVILAACGGSGGDSSGPPVLKVYGDALAARSTAGAQVEGLNTTDMAMLANMRYELAADLPELDGPAAAYVIEPDAPPSDQVDTLLKIFGIEGSLEALSAQSGGGYMAGSLDGMEPALSVSGDALQFWSYLAPWSESYMNPACFDTSVIESLSPPTPVTDSVVVADTEAPQPGTETTEAEPVDPCPEEQESLDVPSEDEARTMFSDLMSDIGVDTNVLDIEVFSDSYGSSVSGFLKIDGVRSPMSWTVSYGPGSQITWAGGVLARPEKFAEYPRIGTTAALKRLNEQQSAFVGQVADPADLAAASGGSGEIVVRVVDVEPELVMLTGVDGSVYLVPGYAFLAEPDEFGFKPRYTVSAIPNEYVESVAPPMGADDSEAGGSASGSEPSLPAGEVSPGGDMEEITSEEANTLLGMSEAEATSTAEGNGWVVRVAARDGEQFALTMDYNPKRVNLTVVDGVVTDVFIG